MARPRVRELTLCAMIGALIFAAKMALAGLPNIEPVSLLVMVCAVTFGAQAVYPIYVYVLLEIVTFGPHLWSLGYLYVWGLLALAAGLLRDMESPLGWAVLSGGFGLLFGALFTPVYLIAGGPSFALSWWISGIPFDLVHCVGNFVLALVLFRPLRNLARRLRRRYGGEN